MAERMKINQLRLAAMDALGVDAVIWEGRDTLAGADGMCVCEALAAGVGVNARGRTQQTARLKLHDMLQLVVLGRTAAAALAEGLEP